MEGAYGTHAESLRNVRFPHSLVNFFCFFFDLGLVSVLEILTGFPETQILSCITRTQSAESKSKEIAILFINS